MKRFLVYFLSFAAAAAFFGCVSLMDKAGQALDGSAFVEKKTALYTTETPNKKSKKETDTENSDIDLTIVQKKNGERSILISLRKYPMMKIRCTYPDENGEFFLTSLEYLAGSVQGWNEYTMELLGTGTLVLDNAAVFSLHTEEIESVQITAGRIHRYDTRITGNEALTSLRNRKERVAAAVDWMGSVENAPKKQILKDFEKYWKPVLFPEIVSKKKRPAGWLLEGDTFEKNDDIRWNTSYSERLLAEELRPVRNSGTLLRDWEEALSWIYMEYEWENIKNILSGQIILQQKK